MVLLNTVPWVLEETFGKGNGGLRCVGGKFVGEGLGCGIDAIASGEDLVVEVPDVR